MLSSRARYGARAVLDLSLHYGDGPVQAQEIAARQKIPQKFLEQILLSLKRADVVRSRKGPGGGYVLARPPREISLGEVVRAVEGPLAPLEGAGTDSDCECGCHDPEVCALRPVWQQAREALCAVLDGASFADLRDRQIDLTIQRDSVHDFVI